MSWTLCIDFGTAFSKAAAAPRDAWLRFDPARVRPLMLGGAGPGNVFLLDSAVFVDDARILFGRAALLRAGALAHAKRAALRSFKTLLSVSDLDRALNTRATGSIDPHRLFTMRDLIVLYLGFLSAAIERAVALDPDLLNEEVALRYAAPAWRSGDSAGMHAAVSRLFGEAEAVRRALGEALLAEEGVPIDAARAALAGARNAAAPEMGLIFEATAAAAYTAVGLERSASGLIVVDMGAGTTDIAALAGAGAALKEIAEARVTLKQAGDFIDGVIANLALDAHGGLKTEARRAEFWRLMMRDMREFKETLFAEGSAACRFDGRTISVSMRDLARDRDFRGFAAALTQAYDHSFAALRQRALAGGRAIQAVAVGGGAAAPFIQEMIRRKPRNAAGASVIARPATPPWAHTSAFHGNLAPVFPQLAIAIGGALAPDGMLATKAASGNSRVSPPATGQIDIQAARD